MRVGQGNQISCRLSISNVVNVKGIIRVNLCVCAIRHIRTIYVHVNQRAYVYFTYEQSVISCTRAKILATVWCDFLRAGRRLLSSVSYLEILFCICCQLVLPLSSARPVLIGDTKPYARDYIWLQQPEATFDSTAEHNLTSTTIERLKWPWNFSDPI